MAPGLDYRLATMTDLEQFYRLFLGSTETDVAHGLLDDGGSAQDS